jgi:hypothetical protein
MTCKWILGVVLAGWFMTHVNGAPTQHDPILVFVTCMSVLNVASDHVTVIQSVLWQSTATNIHDWLWQNVPVALHEHLYRLQHVLEGNMMVQIQESPNLIPVAQSQAHTCQNSLVDLFSWTT